MRMSHPIKAYIKVKTENIGYGELTKTDESSGVKLSGAVYGIYSDSGCTNRVQTMTTDGNGYAKSAALVAGTYYVKEITAPKGYVLSGKVHTLTVKAGQTTGISATDKEQLGAITIYKEGEVLSSWNGSNFTYEKKKLSGATFKVTAGADIYKADGTKVYSAGDVVAESLTTGTDGQVVLSDLHLGTYVVTEIKSIDGYTINTTPQTVAVEYKDQTVTVQYESTTIENTRQKADVSVVKKDSDTENPLDGGKYTLYAGNDIKNYAGQVIVTKGTALETVTTGADGKASYSVDLPISNGYYIQETQAPYAYIRNSKDVYSFNFNVLPETQAKASFSHTFVNDRTTAKIHIYKVDKESGKAVAQGDASLEGAVYGLYARNDIVHPDGATGVVFKAGDLVATLTTDKNGEAEVNNLYLGNYYVKEITPSEGYLLDEEEHDVVYAKEDIVSADGLDTVYHKAGDKVATIVTNDKGIARVDDLPLGKYYLVETKTIDGFVLDDTPIESDLSYIDQNTKVVFAGMDVTNERQKVQITVTKTDSETKEALEGAVFGLFAKEDIVNKDGKVIVKADTQIERTVTGKDGKAAFTSDLPLGQYYVKEIEAPKGYVKSDKIFDVDASYQGDKVKVKVNEVRAKEGSNIKGFATVVFGDSFKITNIAILENKDKGELFVSMPRYRSNERDESNGVIYKDVCNPITAEFREELYTNILDAYARIKEPEKEETQKQDRTQEMPEFSVTVTPYERKGSNIKGLARIYFENSFIVNNINIVQGKEKIFVSMPSYKTKQVDEQGKPIYQDVCYPVTKDFREKLYNEIISEYEKAKDKSNEKARESAEKHHGNPDKEKDKEATPFR